MLSWAVAHPSGVAYQLTQSAVNPSHARLKRGKRAATGITRSAG